MSLYKERPVKSKYKISSKVRFLLYCYKNSKIFFLQQLFSIVKITMPLRQSLLIFNANLNKKHILLLQVFSKTMAFYQVAYCDNIIQRNARKLNITLHSTFVLCCGDGWHFILHLMGVKKHILLRLQV